MNLLRTIPFIIIMAMVAGHSEPALIFSGGVGVSSTTDTDSVTVASTTRQSYHFGVGFEQNFTENISMQTGFSFEGRGEKESKTIPVTETVAQSITEELSLRYLQIPIYVTYGIKMGSFKASVFTGPELGIFLEGKNSKNVDTYSAGALVASDKDTSDVAKQMNMLDYGISAGLGFEYQIGSAALFLNGSYYYGIGSILDYDQKNDATGEIKPNITTNTRGMLATSNNMKLAVGVKFYFKEESLNLY